MQPQEDILQLGNVLISSVFYQTTLQDYTANWALC